MDRSCRIKITLEDGEDKALDFVQVINYEGNISVLWRDVIPSMISDFNMRSNWLRMVKVEHTDDEVG